MAADGEFEFGGTHAGAVVGYPQQALAAACRRNLDAGRARVDGVFDQFLGGTCGPFDDLTGGDLVDDGFGEQADGHGHVLLQIRGG